MSEPIKVEIVARKLDAGEAWSGLAGIIVGCSIVFGTLWLVISIAAH